MDAVSRVLRILIPSLDDAVAEADSGASADGILAEADPGALDNVVAEADPGAPDDQGIIVARALLPSLH